MFTLQKSLFHCSSLSLSNILIKNGCVVNSDMKKPNTDVFISGEKILKIGKNLSNDPEINKCEDLKIIDAENKYVMPGGIDPHVHMELPFMGTVSADDFYTGTQAAVSGGTTMIIDFCFTNSPEESYIDAFKRYRKSADSKVVCDYGLHVGITKWDKQTKKDMIELTEKHGINSYKFFLAYKGALMVNDDQFYEGVKHAASIGALPQVHAENGDLVEKGQEKMIELGITGPEGHVLSRPADVEAEAVHRACLIAEKAGAPLYVVHVMSKLALDEVIRAKERGMRVIGEPIVGGLILDDHKVYDPNWEEACKYIMSPPIRPKGNNEHLTNALARGILDCVGTDHCVFNIEQRKMGKDDFRKIPNGMNGVEDRMSLLWNHMVHSGRVSPMDYVRFSSTKAAQIFNIYPQKGVIREGSDADVIVLDPNQKKTISVKTHHQNLDYNVFEGMEVNCDITHTISRGNLVWENGKLKTEKGKGKFVKTPPYSYIFDGLKESNERKAPKPVKRD